MSKSCTILTIIFILLISCQKQDWKSSLLNEISEYEKSEQIEKEYLIEHNSGDEIIVELFRTNSIGLRKLNARYKRSDLGDWEKLFFTKNGKVVYSRNFGIAPVYNSSTDSIENPEYVLTERIVWFTNDSIGEEERKELLLHDLNNVESKKAELNQMEFMKLKLNRTDYDLVTNDFELLNE